MKLWTIQPLEVLDEIDKKGYYICDKNKSMLLKDYEIFQRAYDWLVPKMEQRIGKRPKGVEYPVWAWYKRDWQNKKPDLRTNVGEPKKKNACIELDIDDRRVVLSDFGNWNIILNGGYVDETNTEEGWNRLHNYLDSLPPAQRDFLTRQSWDTVFDITPFENDWREVGKYVQATFWALYREDIKNVQIFKGK